MRANRFRGELDENGKDIYEGDELFTSENEAAMTTIQIQPKSYMVDIKMEVVATGGNNVEGIRIHGFSNEEIPVKLWCDLLRRFGQMTPGKDVMFITNGKRITQNPITTTIKKWE